MKYFIRKCLKEKLPMKWSKKKIKELKPKHPHLATILENIHEMSLEDTVRGTGAF